MCAGGQAKLKGVAHEVKVETMKGFIILAHRGFVTGSFLTDRDAKGPIVGMNGRCNNMIVPCMMK